MTPRYDQVRNWQGGNPYKDQILALMTAGVAFEECGETMKATGLDERRPDPRRQGQHRRQFPHRRTGQDGFVDPAVRLRFSC